MSHLLSKTLVLATGVFAFNAAPGDATTAPLLGDCTRFALHGHAGVAASGTNTVIYGDIGGNADATGFGASPLPHVYDGGWFEIFSPTASESTSCSTDKQAAYTSAIAATCTNTNMTTNLGGLTLTPGVFCSAVGTFSITSGSLTLDGNGNEDAVFIFQSTSAIITSTDTSVVVTNGAQAKNVFWVAGSAINLAEHSTFQGNLLANSTITMGTGTVLFGRAFANTAGITLAGKNVVSKPVDLLFDVQFDSSKEKADTTSFAPQNMPQQQNTKMLTVASSANGFVASLIAPLMRLRMDESQDWFVGFNQLPEPYGGDGERRRLQGGPPQAGPINYTAITYVQAMISFQIDNPTEYYEDANYDLMGIDNTTLCNVLIDRFDDYLVQMRLGNTLVQCPLYDEPAVTSGDYTCLISKTATCYAGTEAVYGCDASVVSVNDDYIQSCTQFARRRLKSSTEDEDRKQLRKLEASETGETLFRPVVTVSSDSGRQNTVVRANVLFERGGYAIRTNNKCMGGLEGNVDRTVEVRSSKADVSALDATDEDCINTPNNCVEYQPFSLGFTDASDVQFPSLYGRTNDVSSSLDISASLVHKGECLADGSVADNSYVVDVVVTDDAPRVLGDNRERSSISLAMKDGTDGLDFKVVSPIFNRAVMSRAVSVKVSDTKLDVAFVVHSVIAFDNAGNASAVLDEGQISVTIDTWADGFCVKVSGLLTSDENGTPLTAVDKATLPLLATSAFRVDRVGAETVKFSAKVLPSCPQLTCFTYNANDNGNLELDTFRDGDSADCQNLTGEPTKAPSKTPTIT